MKHKGTKHSARNEAALEAARDHARAARVAEGKPAEDPADDEFRALNAEREQTATLFARVAKKDAAKRKSWKR